MTVVIKGVLITTSWRSYNIFQLLWGMLGFPSLGQNWHIYTMIPWALLIDANELTVYFENWTYIVTAPLWVKLCQTNLKPKANIGTYLWVSCWRIMVSMEYMMFKQNSIPLILLFYSDNYVGRNITWNHANGYSYQIQFPYFYCTWDCCAQKLIVLLSVTSFDIFCSNLNLKMDLLPMRLANNNNNHMKTPWIVM